MSSESSVRVTFVVTIFVIIVMLGLGYLVTRGVSDIPGGDVAQRLTRVFIVFIAALFLLAAVQLAKNDPSMSGLARSIPALLPSLGILGTFIGIFIGLYNFDVHHLDKSVPQLLEGLKIAFSTSIAGLASSVALKTSHSLVVKIGGGVDPFRVGGVGGIAVQSQIRDQLKGIAKGVEEASRTLDQRLQEMATQIKEDMEKSRKAVYTFQSERVEGVMNSLVDVSRELSDLLNTIIEMQREEHDKETGDGDDGGLPA